LPIGAKPVLAQTLERLASSEIAESLTVVIHPDDRELYDAAISMLPATALALLTEPVTGGATRQASVRNGLETLVARSPDVVLIHDGARPYPSVDLVRRAAAAAENFGAAIPAMPVTDTLKRVNGDGRLIGTVDRTALRAAQTPQAFRFPLILQSHRQAADGDLTDDAAVAEQAGHAVYVFDGDPANRKITTMQDVQDAEVRLRSSATETRVGQGFDVHAFEPGDHVWLGGVRIDHDRKLSGHSDADVVLHAIADALYGAIADGDIGAHFPPSDPQWRGADSSIFLAHAAKRVRERGATIVNLDATLICEAPKVGPHRDAMRARIGEIAGLAVDRVAIKATTSERLGFTGRKEGIACLALATIATPSGG
jgi:2-C-methyl-D-erythritol 4-phosphate cytidylyltransferase/2-C-methyl-D-erythritol 2,4-cyclodiphosphate synthase